MDNDTIVARVDAFAVLLRVSLGWTESPASIEDAIDIVFGLLEECNDKRGEAYGPSTDVSGGPAGRVLPGER